MTTVLQGTVKAQRNRRKPPISNMSNTTENSDLSLSEVVHMSRDRQHWHGTMSRFEPNDFDFSDADR